MLYEDKYPLPVSGQELPDGIVWAHNRFRYCYGPECREQTRYRSIRPTGWFCSEECRDRYVASGLATNTDLLLLVGHW